MSETKTRTRKQPLACLPDLDAIDNIESKGVEAKKSPGRISKSKNGKENLKKSVSSTKLKSKIKQDVDTDSDSDSDFGELWNVLKKSGVKTKPITTSCGRPAKNLDQTTPKEKPKHVSAKQESTIKRSIKGRKRLYSEDEDDEKFNHVTPAKRSRRVSTISQGSAEAKKIINRENSAEKQIISRRDSKRTPTKDKESLSDRQIISRRNSIRTPAKEIKVTPIKICKVNSPGVPDQKVMVVVQQKGLRDKSTAALPGYTTPLKNQEYYTPNKRSTPTGCSKKCETPKTPLEYARTSLHVAAVPNSLPCREHEYQNIYNFVENKVMDEVGGCMYISGVPGTGKTATVTQVIRKLQEASVNGSIPHFQYIEINGMKLSDPRQAYVQLYQKIFEKKDRISSDAAQKKLDGYFNKADKMKKTTVLLVDELDLMCNRKQDVVYNLLDWPSKPYSRLVVLTIANTMDMPERKLKGRVNSRLGLTRLTFLPYTHKQLEEIVLARLQGTDSFVLDAVRLATRKVAAVSGDARRALDICRRASELPTDNEPVRITHIEQAIKEMTNSNIVRLIRSCSELEKLFLKSVSEVGTRTGLEEVDFLQIVEHLLPMCILTGLDRPPIPGLLGLCHRLKCFRLLFTNNHRGGLQQRITLNLTEDDLHYALKAET